MKPLIVRHEVEVFRAKAMCPVCTEVRQLKYTGVQLLSYPPMYPHECSTCGYTANLDYVYPRIEYK